ncbi:D-tyrosyl-tRNA(Tyr) deacylase [Candidatus Wirthbacteria bacterium CG2_30_54_11]|uniref:D-aminoacyl-tRNA deacylase n=1 Tax=Candidatus Wirthbacteria bacterium CG2_30_54_11 TaxID=1817892 RepID=A0A1J5J4T7_9BACT|nr:MAG: D-tyrosyl-tRNA(Tyr) deacylase [Candidatus Wirthbacteria bacterium CG2_30_54_11]
MRAVIQRSARASVSVDGKVVGEINHGLVILLGVKTGDNEADADYLADKIVNLRIFPDGEDKMNRSLLGTGGQALIISQFTLYGDSRRGRRPSFIEAAPPQQAKQLYDYFVNRVQACGITTATGTFQAMMSVQLVNEGPVTLIVESKPDQT